MLSAPLFKATGSFTRTMLFVCKGFRDMDKADRIRACCLRACLCQVAGRRMAGSALRERFGILARHTAQVSRLLKEVREAGQMVVQAPSVGKRGRTCLPFWVALGTAVAARASS